VSVDSPLFMMGGSREGHRGVPKERKPRKMRPRVSSIGGSFCGGAWKIKLNKEILFTGGCQGGPCSWLQWVNGGGEGGGYRRKQERDKRRYVFADFSDRGAVTHGGGVESGERLGEGGGLQRGRRSGESRCVVGGRGGRGSEKIEYR